MKKKKFICLLSLMSLFSYNVVPSVTFAQESSVYSTSELPNNIDLEAVVSNLSSLYPQFSVNEIRTAVYQCYNGEKMTLPKDPTSSGYSSRTWKGITTGQLAFAINAAISLATGGAISNLSAKLSQSALRTVRNSIRATLARYGASWIGSIFIDEAVTVLDPGWFIANRIDSIDSIDTIPNNGRINLW